MQEFCLAADHPLALVDGLVWNFGIVGRVGQREGGGGGGDHVN